MNAPAPFDVGALIPWYLNGTLSEAERTQVEALLRESPEAESQLQMWRSVQLQVKTQPSVDPGTELGWQRLRRTIKHEKGREPGRLWRMALAASVLLVLGLQTSILMRQDSGARYEPLSGTEALENAWRVQVRFVDSATIADINALLLRLDARVVSGPSALGIYELAIARAAVASADALRNQLASEPLLQQVVVTP